MDGVSETDTDAASDGSSCVDLFAEAQCLGGGLKRLVVGDVDVPDADPPTVTELDGGVLVEGMIGDIEVLYADDSCVVACEWRLPQTSFCQAVDDEGRIVCTYATGTITVEGCQDFLDACG